MNATEPQKRIRWSELQLIETLKLYMYLRANDETMNISNSSVIKLAQRLEREPNAIVMRLQNYNYLDGEEGITRSKTSNPRGLKNGGQESKRVWSIYAKKLWEDIRKNDDNIDIQDSSHTIPTTSDLKNSHTNTNKSANLVRFFCNLANSVSPDLLGAMLTDQGQSDMKALMTIINNEDSTNRLVSILRALTFIKNIPTVEFENAINSNFDQKSVEQLNKILSIN